MRMSIGVPCFSIYFDHRQVKPFIKKHSKTAKELFHERVVPVVLQGTCKALEVVANSTADAHDYLISKTKSSVTKGDNQMKHAEKAKRYLEKRGIMCPFCDSQDIEGGSMDFEAGEIVRESPVINATRDGRMFTSSLPWRTQSPEK